MSKLIDLWTERKDEAIKSVIQSYRFHSRSRARPWVRGDSYYAIGASDGYFLVDDKEYWRGIPSKKRIQEFIANFEGIDFNEVDRVKWKYQYFVEGHTKSAESFYEFAKGDGDNLDARVYWDVEIEPEMLKRGV